VNTSISSSWTTNSEIHTRIRGGNGSYYYEVFEVTVALDGDYIFTSNSSIRTVGLLYKENFFPNLTSLNLYRGGISNGENGQFQFTTYVQSNKRYILVATTNLPLTTGTYTLLVSGLARVNLLPINSTSIISTSTTTTIGESILFTFFSNDYTIIIHRHFL